jgi:hypothetical protein
MLLNQNSHTSNDLAREARILALKSIPTKHAIPATKAAKTAAYLCKWKGSKEHKSGGSKLYQLPTGVLKLYKNVVCGTCKVA